MEFENFATKKENFILEKFTEWLNSTEGKNYTIVDRPDPPDAILEDSITNEKTWVEITECYYSEELARDYSTYYHELKVHIPMNTKNVFCNMDEDFAHKFCDLVERKISKSSYDQSHEEYGGGYLVVRLVSPWFDDDTLNEMELAFDESIDCGVFANIIVCYGVNEEFTFQLWHSC